MSHSILRLDLIAAAQTFDREKISRNGRANEGFECREEIKMQKTTLACWPQRSASTQKQTEAFLTMLKGERRVWRHGRKKCSRSQPAIKIS
jgi:hypothetical protein